MHTGPTFRALLAGFSLGLALTSPLRAISIYDVIELSRQDYSDQEIVAIVESTGSVFELTAEDVPRLKALGVSEPVIRKMLEAAAPPDATAGERPPPGAPTGQSPDPAAAHEPHQASDQPGGYQPSQAPSQAPGQAAPSRALEAQRAPISSMPAVFSVSPIWEELAGGHSHMLVFLDGLRLFVLRDEGGYPSVMERSWAVARQLEEAARLVNGEFRSVHENGGDVVIFEGGASQPFIPIMSVSEHDAHAYDVRSEQRVSPDRLGEYWSALLNDYWAIAFQRKPPRQLVYLHQGDALKLLFDVANGPRGGGAESLGSAALQLPRSVQRHLERFATAVPEDFRPEPSSQRGESP